MWWYEDGVGCKEAERMSNVKAFIAENNVVKEGKVVSKK